MPAFNMEQPPETWPCLDMNYKRCETCSDAMRSIADCHVLRCYIDGTLEDGTKKAPKASIQQFCGIVNGLLNTLEGGTICTHLDTSLHGQFVQQTADKLRSMCPTESVYNNTFSSSKEKDHMYFSVLPAEEGGRTVSTFDFKTKLPRGVGLDTPSQENIKTFVRKVVHSPRTHHRYNPGTDPEFFWKRTLPDTFGENAKRQIKAIHDDDLKKAPGTSEAHKFANHAICKIIPYICAFATMETGGWIYLGLSEEKKPPDSGRQSSPAREQDMVCTGRYKCDGVKLNDDVRTIFKESLQEMLDTPTKMFRYPETEKLFDDIIKVEFLTVKDNVDLCVVKISVKYFHGILCPDASGPLAFRVEGGAGISKLVRVPFSEWRSAVCQPGRQT